MLRLSFIIALSDATALSNAFYGQGSGPIHIDDVACTGTETNILLCTYDSVTSDCGHSEDAGVQCQVDSRFMDKLTLQSRSYLSTLGYSNIKIDSQK